jgi:hypothetical protein
MSTMLAMHEDMHERTSKENQPRKISEYVGAVLGEEEKCADCCERYECPFGAAGGDAGSIVLARVLRMHGRPRSVPNVLLCTSVVQTITLVSAPAIHMHSVAPKSVRHAYQMVTFP